MKWFVLSSLLLVGCAGNSRAHVGVDPTSGEQVVYSTVFFKGARMVLTAPMRGAERVRLALWTPPAVVGSCTVGLRLAQKTIMGDDVKVEIVRAGFAPEGEPAAADRVVEFTLPLTALDLASDGDASLMACGEEWAFDDDARRALIEFRELTSDSVESD